MRAMHDLNVKLEEPNSKFAFAKTSSLLYKRIEFHEYSLVQRIADNDGTTFNIEPSKES